MTFIYLSCGEKCRGSHELWEAKAIVYNTITLSPAKESCIDPLHDLQLTTQIKQDLLRPYATSTTRHVRRVFHDSYTYSELINRIFVMDSPRQVPHSPLSISKHNIHIPGGCLPF